MFGYDVTAATAQARLPPSLHYRKPWRRLSRLIHEKPKFKGRIRWVEERDANDYIGAA